MNSFVSDNPSLVNNNMFNTYVLLKKGADVKMLEQSSRFLFSVTWANS
jgi:hypothetical protein